MRLSKREQAKRHAAHMSKNRVKVPEGHQDRQGLDSAEHSSRIDCPWHEASQIDLGAVVRDLQAGKADAEGESLKDTQPGTDCESAASPADDVPNPDAEDNCTPAEQGPQAKAHDSDGSPSCKAAPDSAMNNQQRHRQRAESALTAAPHPNSPSDRTAAQQPNESTATSQQDSDRTSTAPASKGEIREASSQQRSATPCASAAQSASEVDPTQTSASASPMQDSTGLQAMSDSEQQLEAKLSALTDRLHAAEQAAGSHSQLQQQLQQLKQDKNALQADLKQFTDHISTMMTTLQSQVSKLLLTDPKQGLIYQLGAVQNRADEGSHSQGSVGSAPVQWNVESHGMAPSPLARHQIFQSEALKLPRATHSHSDTATEHLRMPLDAESANSQLWTSLSKQAKSQSVTAHSAEADAALPSSADDCIFDDEVGLPSFAQMAEHPSASQLPTADSKTHIPHLQSTQHALSAAHSQAPNAAHSQAMHPRQPQHDVSQVGDFTTFRSPQLLQSQGSPGSASGLEAQQEGYQRLAGAHQQTGLDSVSVQSQGHKPLRSLPSPRSTLCPAPPQHSQRWQPPAVGLPDFGLGFSGNDPQPSPLPQTKHDTSYKMQRLMGVENRQPNWVPQFQPGSDTMERQALKEVVMPELRHRGLPHAPLPQVGAYQGPSSLRLKPMSVGQPPAAAMNKHDSLALSVWASAQRNSRR